MILSNPKSSNAFITNYSYIIERLVDEETLFASLYIEAEFFYKTFNFIYTSTFQKHFNSDLSALEILLAQLNKIKRNPKDIDEHIKLLNTLYKCIDKKYVISEYDEQKSIGCIDNKGLLEITNNHLQPFNNLFYFDEYNTNRKK